MPEWGRIWEGLCTSCICYQCKLNPRYPVTLIALTSVLCGLTWVGLGVWLTVTVILNSHLPPDDQLLFEKLSLLDPSDQLNFYNESSFVFASLDNLKFYLFSISIIAILGGLGRAIASLSLLLYIHKKTLSYVMSWAWVILSMLSVASLALLTVDTFYTLSHNDVAPPHLRDFYFKNDHWRFYTFCHVFKFFIIVDFVAVCYFQWVVRWAQRHPVFTTATV